MKIKRLYFILIIAFLFMSCEKKSLLEKFDVIENIYHVPVPINNDEIYSEIYEFISDSIYLIACDVNSEYFFSLTDLKKNEIVARFGKKGTGPGELVTPPSDITPLKNNQFCFWDTNLRTLFCIHYDNSDNNFFPYKILTFANRELTIFNIIPLDNNKYVALGLFEEGRYLLLDSLGNEISYHFNYPEFEGDEIFTKPHKALAFQGNLKRKPDGNRFYFSCWDSEIFEIFSMENNELSRIAEIHGEYGTFVPETFGKNSIATAIRKESKVRFVSTDCTDEYIYLLYSGKVIADGFDQAHESNIILVFDWDGKPVKRYSLDIDIRCFTVNELSNTIYGYDQKNEQLVAFSLD